MSFQLYTHNARMGALNLLGIKPDVFTVENEAVGAMLATHATVAMMRMSRVPWNFGGGPVSIRLRSPAHHA